MVLLAPDCKNRFKSAVKGFFKLFTIRVKTRGGLYGTYKHETSLNHKQRRQLMKKGVPSNFVTNKRGGWTIYQDTQQRLGLAECCGGNTQGSGTSGSYSEPLNNFIDRFCSLQLTGHTTPVYFSLQQPKKVSRG